MRHSRAQFNKVSSRQALYLRVTASFRVRVTRYQKCDPNRLRVFKNFDPLISNKKPHCHHLSVLCSVNYFTQKQWVNSLIFRWFQFGTYPSMLGKAQRNRITQPYWSYMGTRSRCNFRKWKSRSISRESSSNLSVCLPMLLITIESILQQSNNFVDDWL